MKKSAIKKNIQKWYLTCLWYGEVDTPLGVLKEYALHRLAKEVGVTLVYEEVY